MRNYKNYLGLSALREKCILIADGPSKSIILSDPTIATEDYSIAVVNRVGYQWPGRKDYWFSLHPEYFPEWVDNSVNLGDCKMIGFKGARVLFPHRNYINTNYRIITGGTSSLFAVENLIAMGYKEIDMYGVDLDRDKYLGHRRVWKSLYEDIKQLGVIVTNRGGVWV